MPAGVYKRTYTTLKQYIERRTVAHPNGCLVWAGSRTKLGYGTANWRNGSTAVRTTAHRAAYVAFVGPIPEGLEIDHKCKNTLCVNPAHLEAVTHYENVQRSAVAGKSACKYGHPFDDQNTVLKKNGTKRCKKCNARRQRELRQQHRNQRGPK